MYSIDITKDNAYIATPRVGLEENEIATLQRSLPPRYDLRHLKNNESLKLLPQKKAEQSRVVAYKLTSGKFSYTVYRISDKKFYNLSGIGGRAGLDYPLPITIRLSSPSDPARLNPASGKVSPYNGIDYSVPMNTKIVSIINRKATWAEYNSTMGYFAKVSGKDNIKTRHLHLDKILVRKGTPVSRGAVITLSGNSGCPSGSHFYYELVISNNPANSLTFRTVGPADNNKFEQHTYAHTRGYGRYLG